MDEELEIEIIPNSKEQGNGEISFNDGSVSDRRLDFSKLLSQNCLTSQQGSSAGKLSNQKADQIRPESKKKKDQSYKDYKVILVQTNVGYGQRGMNKYYKIQLLEDRGRFTLSTEWGRIGAPNPGTIDKHCDSRDEAIKGFEQLFYKKTHNKWDHRNNFMPFEGKYVIHSYDGEEMDKKAIDELNQRNELIKYRIEANKTTLPAEISSLMKMIWDINKMSKTLQGRFCARSYLITLDFQFDKTKYPLGKISVDKIQKG